MAYAEPMVRRGSGCKRSIRMDFRRSSTDVVPSPKLTPSSAAELLERDAMAPLSTAHMRFPASTVGWVDAPAPASPQAASAPRQTTANEPTKYADTFMGSS